MFFICSKDHIMRMWKQNWCFKMKGKNNSLKHKSIKIFMLWCFIIICMPWCFKRSVFSFHFVEKRARFLAVNLPNKILNKYMLFPNEFSL